MTKNELKELGALSEKKFRARFNQFIAEGVKIVTMAINAKAPIEKIFIRGSDSMQPVIVELMKLAGKAQIPYETCSPAEFKKISTQDTPSGVLALIKIGEQKPAPGYTVLVVDHIQDPGNLGTIIRTADWFGVRTIYISEGSVDLYNPKTVQATMGSIFTVQVAENMVLKDLIPELRGKGYNIIATALNGTSTLPKKDKNVLIIGSESHGVSPEVQALSHILFTIPGVQGGAESLNAGVATGIALFAIQNNK